ncbi:hypothetical protein F3Y22_tig00111390pilonHSYRG00136 [Hibiscus syriacus]|uniref:Uncharacterized protein n=1 Tax=Hibiscus syriacus TaxID=106335 RepID=A0A6A2YMC6_HIBSY|nr:hypothetical protein F3Y22_tig00111390pilonHSYRG00136 [Hibiscus syriacus]
MSAEMLRFYTDLLGFEDAGVKSCGVDLLKSLFGYELPCAAAASLVEEDDFLAAIRDFFQSGTLLPAFNATAIALMGMSLVGSRCGDGFENVPAWAGVDLKICTHHGWWAGGGLKNSRWVWGWGKGYPHPTRPFAIPIHSYDKYNVCDFHMGAPMHSTGNCGPLMKEIETIISNGTLTRELVEQWMVNPIGVPKR